MSQKEIDLNAETENVRQQVTEVAKNLLDNKMFVYAESEIVEELEFQKKENSGVEFLADATFSGIVEMICIAFNYNKDKIVEFINDKKTGFAETGSTYYLFYVGSEIDVSFGCQGQPKNVGLW